MRCGKTRTLGGHECLPSAEPRLVHPKAYLAYRLLTGPDDAAFCHRVSEALALGYELYGSPAATFNGKEVIVAQAIVWPSKAKA
jgi:hypothetical protein